MAPASLPAWEWSNLRRPGPALAAITGLVIAALSATVVSCNVHELGHAVVATLLGWEVERIDLCLPGRGAVVYARVGTWAGNAQGYAGGLAGASVLIGVYLLGFHRGERPLRGPGMWFAGLGMVLPIGAQVVVGGLEGAVGPGEDYIQRFASLLPPLVILVTAAVVVAYTRRWRLGRPRRDAPAGRDAPPRP